jgi:hypothetical protein
MRPLTTLATTPPITGNPSDLASLKRSLVGYLGETAERADSALDELAGVGPSPIPGGDEAARAVHDALGTLRTSFRTARDEVAHLDERDPIRRPAGCPASSAGCR